MVSHWETLQCSVSDVESGWRDFLRGLPAGRAVRSPILQSWERCRQAGVDHRREAGNVVWGGDSLRDAEASNELLLTASAAVLSSLKDLLRESGQILALCDPKARVLVLEGDRSARRVAERINLVPSSDWSEWSSGTNAMGTAAAEGTAVTVFAAEHYLEGLHPWACVAAPILHPLRRAVMGILDLSGEYMAVSRHSEMAIASAVQAIQGRIALLESRHQQALLEAFSEQISRSRSNPAALIDRSGRVLRVWSAGPALPVPDTLWQDGARHTLETGREFAGESTTEEGRRLRLRFRPVWAGTALVGAVAEAAAVTVQTRSATNSPPALEGLVGSSPRWLAALDRAARASRTDSTLLVSGETGTGKEVLARAVHRASHRAAGPFVAVNCGALPLHFWPVSCSATSAVPSPGQTQRARRARWRQPAAARSFWTK